MASNVDHSHWLVLVCFLVAIHFGRLDCFLWFPLPFTLAGVTVCTRAFIHVVCACCSMVSAMVFLYFSIVPAWYPWVGQCLRTRTKMFESCRYGWSDLSLRRRVVSERRSFDLARRRATCDMSNKHVRCRTYILYTYYIVMYTHI